MEYSKSILPEKVTKMQPLLKVKTKVYVRNVYKHIIKYISI